MAVVDAEHVAAIEASRHPLGERGVERLCFTQKAREQDYAVLGYLNIRPRTTYSGKLRNPNPRMPDFRPLPLSRVEYSRKNEPASHGHGDHGSAKPAEKGPSHGSAAGAPKTGGLS